MPIEHGQKPILLSHSLTVSAIFADTLLALTASPLVETTALGSLPPDDAYGIGKSTACMSGSYEHMLAAEVILVEKTVNRHRDGIPPDRS